MEPDNLPSKTILCAALLVLTGCEAPVRTGYYDQDVRREVFFECLSKLPAGPTAPKYNDWAEVVDECGSQALAISARGFRDTRAAEKVEKQ